MKHVAELSARVAWLRLLRLAIVSTKFRYRIEGFLAGTGLLGLVDAIVGMEDVPTPKPDPTGILAALARLGIERAEAVYVGDSTVDAEAAHNAGVSFVAVLSPAHEAVRTGAHRALPDGAAGLPHLALAHDRDEGQAVENRYRRVRANVQRVVVDDAGLDDVPGEAHDLGARQGPHALEAELHVGGGHGAAAVEAGAGVQEEAPGAVVAVDPAQGEPRAEGHGAIEAHEALEHVVEHHGRDVVEVQLRIQRHGLDAQEHAERRAGLRPRPPLAAGASRKQGHEQEGGPASHAAPGAMSRLARGQLLFSLPVVACALPEQIVELFKGWRTAFPDVVDTVTSSLASGNKAVLEVTWKGTHTGPLTTAEGTIAASGKVQETPAAVFYTFEGNKIKSSRQYFDSLTLLKQIGVQPK